MQTLNDNPVTLATWVKGVALAVLGLTAYYLQMTPEEMALWTALVLALCIGLDLWVKQRTTPTAKPIDDDGTPLIRADDGRPSARAAAAGRWVVREEPTSIASATARGAKPSVNWNS